MDRLAHAAGVALDWQDARGQPQRVAPEVAQRVLNALGLPADDAASRAQSLAVLADEARACPPLVTAQAGSPIIVTGAGRSDLAYCIEQEDGTRVTGTADSTGEGRLRLPALAEAGYHRLILGQQELTLANAPARGFTVQDLPAGRGRPWGVAAQLYSLRRSAAGTGDARGVGDFTALTRLAASVARAGGDAVAISPVHAMFSADTHRYSPYAPSSRLFLNAVHADPRDTFSPRAVEAALAVTGAGERLLTLEDAELVEWPEVARLRLDLLAHLFAGFPANASPAAATQFESFLNQGGDTLMRHARFEALHEHYVAQGNFDWRQWPAEHRDPTNPAVTAFAQAHAERVRFHAFVQWLADLGLAKAHRTAIGAGMRIGLIADLAVGTDPAGSHAWSRQEEITTGLSPGAPPDIYNPKGQAWGLTAFSPRALRRHGYAAYLEMLRAALAHAGGLRIDHALGLARLWLVPEGAPPSEGAYVSLPFEDLMRLTALESHRHRALILGENLGTVPEGFNAQIARYGMLGMQVLWFQRDNAWPPGFVPPSQWNTGDMATTSTHDLPTVAGWWQGRDIDWRSRLDLLGDGSESEERAARAGDRHALWKAIRPAPEAPEPAPESPPVDDAIDFLGRTANDLVLLPLEDALGLVEQPNLPGTIDSHPNWRRRLPVAADDLAGQAPAAARLQRLADARTRSS
nr:4-alpha-glucanotransferase [Verticiella sp. GG226]